MNQKVVPDAQSIGKQMHQDPTHGHREHVTQEAKEEALQSKGSFDEGGKADPPPKGSLSPEQIMSLDEIPSDPKEIEKLLGLEIGDKSLEKGPEGDAQVHRQNDAIERGDLKPHEVTTQTEEPPRDDKSAAANATATAAAAGKDKAPTAQEFVESRDGKHRIPYAVLENSRKNEARLNSELAQARVTIEQLQKGQVSGEGKSTAAETAEHNDAAEKAATGALTDEDFAALEESFPEKLVNALRKVNALAGETHSVLKEIETEAEVAERAEAHSMAQTVQDIIDRDTQLTEIQQDPEKWEEAVRLDDALKGTKRWGDKPFAERIVEVKKMMGYTPDPAQEARQEATPTAEELAAEKIRKAAAKQNQSQGRAFTHSDLPGGNAPAQSERDAVASMDIHSLAKRVDGMTPAQLERFIASI